MDVLLDNLGETIKKIRKAKGLSQRELAKLAKVSDATISKLENGTGNITIENIKKIVSALGFSFEEILKIAKGEKVFAENILVLDQSFLQKYHETAEKDEKKIGKVIKKYREMKEISLEELSRITDLPVDLLFNIELGFSEIRFSVLKKIANALGITVDEIIEEAEKEDMKTKPETSQERDLKAFLNGLDGIMFYGGKPMDETDIKLIKSIVERLIENKTSQDRE